MLLICLIVLTVSIYPVSASSFQGIDTPNPYRFYALIPYSTKSVTVSGTTFSSGVDGGFFDFLPECELPDYPTRSPISSEQVGWELDGAINTLQTDFVTEPYSTGSNYYGAFDYYLFKANGSVPKSLKMSLVAEDFHITADEWWDLWDNALLYLPAAATVRVSFDVTYYSLGSDGSTFTMHHGSTSNLVSTSGPGSVKYYPAYWTLFSESGTLIDGGYSVGRLVMTLEFDNYPGKVGLGMLYAQHEFDVEKVGVVETTKEVIVEKEVVKVVPAEELDLFSWLIPPIQAFFNMQLFPGISLGGIISALAIILMVFLIIRSLG